MQAVKLTPGEDLQDGEEMDEDRRGDEDEKGYGMPNCASLLQSLYLRICKGLSLPSDSDIPKVCEEKMDTSCNTKVLAEIVVEALSGCVHLLLDYDVFQVRLKHAYGSTTL